jgi:hypothetical protein
MKRWRGENRMYKWLLLPLQIGVARTRGKMMRWRVKLR